MPLGTLIGGFIVELIDDILKVQPVQACVEVLINAPNLGTFEVNA